MSATPSFTAAPSSRRGLAHRLATFGVLAGLIALAWPDVVPALADEDNIPDVVVSTRSRSAIEVPYRYGNVVVGSDIVTVLTMRENNQILITGKSAGTTNLLVYDTRGTLRDEIEVTVVSEALNRTMESVKEILSDIEGLEYGVVNGKIFIRGEVSLDEELSRVKEIADREALVESVVTLSPIAQRLTVSLIESEIGTPGVRVKLVGSQIILEGIVHSDAASRRAEAIAKAYYGERVINVLEIREADRIPGRQQTVVINAHYVELAKSLTSIWGIEWTPLATQTGLTGFFQRDYIDGWLAPQGSVTATVTALLPRLDAARTSGYARVLDNPTVSVKSGEMATIFSGSEYPYVVANGLTTNVEWKDIGIRLDVTPYAQGTDVDMDLHVLVTALGEVTASGFQAVDKSEIHTSEFCRAGESIVIGGLQRISDRVQYNKVPNANVAFGQPLVTLYGGRDYRKSKSQFLVFLTPQIHESSSSANQEIKNQFNLQEVRQ